MSSILSNAWDAEGNLSASNGGQLSVQLEPTPTTFTIGKDPVENVPSCAVSGRYERGSVPKHLHARNKVMTVQGIHGEHTFSAVSGTGAEVPCDATDERLDGYF